jgi:hypothetical protein
VTAHACKLSELLAFTSVPSGRFQTLLPLHKTGFNDVAARWFYTTAITPNDPLSSSYVKKYYNLPEILRGGMLSAIVGFYGPRNSPFSWVDDCWGRAAITASMDVSPTTVKEHRSALRYMAVVLLYCCDF